MNTKKIIIIRTLVVISFIVDDYEISLTCENQFTPDFDSLAHSIRICAGQRLSEFVKRRLRHRALVTNNGPHSRIFLA